MIPACRGDPWKRAPWLNHWLPGESAVWFYMIYKISTEGTRNLRGPRYYWKTNSEILKTKRSVFSFTQSRFCKTNSLGHPLTESLLYGLRANRGVPLGVVNFTPPTPKGTPQPIVHWIYLSFPRIYFSFYGCNLVQLVSILLWNKVVLAAVENLEKCFTSNSETVSYSTFSIGQWHGFHALFNKVMLFWQSCL